jgi:hypothetical protein
MNKSKARPILFSAPMIRALLNGTKIQTRRSIKPQPDLRPGEMLGPTRQRIDTAYWHWKDEWWWQDPQPSMIAKCPYGARGDHLWVREALDLWPGGAVYSADGEPVGVDRPDWGKESAFLESYSRSHVPSIHMPRWASRITLEITNVKVERLQDISYDDAIAEGIEPYPGNWPVRAWMHYGDRKALTNPIVSFETLWDSINSKKPGCSWQDNPWIWKIEFRHLK